MVWTNWSIPGLFTSAVALAIAVVVLRTDKGLILNRRLAFLLLLEGVYIGCSVGLVFLVASPRLARVVSIVGISCFAALPFQYLIFLGTSLKTPLVAPFRPRLSIGLLNLGVAGAMASVLAFPGHFVSDPYSPTWAASNFQMVRVGLWLTQLHGAVSMFGLIAALDAFFRAPQGSAARERAMWFALAFGVKDAYVGLLHILYGSLRPVPFWGDFLYNPGQGLAYLWYVLLLSYGVLRAQLFDIDLKIKWALVRSAVVSVVAGSFFIGSEVLESYIPVQGTLLGLVAAGFVVIALRPVQRFSERVVGLMMPGVDSSPEYVDARKADVYSAAFEAAIGDGVITREERAILERLTVQLGIGESEASALEEAVVSRLGIMVRSPPDV